MANDTVIQVEGISKKFCKSLRHSMLYGAHDLARSFFGLTRHSPELRESEFWSLENVSFELKRGECLGLIGPNGAGKSTLLKILNGIIAPDRGRVEISSRVGALIEVGAGFHPMLSGRENIFVNGAILGFSKQEIGKKFDDIVDFADIGDFIDSPVKNYSSGMHVRLGFAIAAQMEPDVLLIDEVLAVGDAGFRSKCYNCIGRLAKSSAVIFVSHAMPFISRLSTQAMVIDHGRASFHGQPAEAIAHYQRLFDSNLRPSRQGLGVACIHSVQVLNAAGQPVQSVIQGQVLAIRFCVRSDVNIANACLDLVFINLAGEVVAECNNLVAEHPVNLKTGEDIEVCAHIASFSLNAGVYQVSALVLSADMVTHYDWQKDIVAIEVRADRVGVAGQQFRADWMFDYGPVEARR